MTQSILNKTPMTVEAAAAWTGYSKPYLYKLIRQKKIPSYKVNPAKQGKVFLCREELAEFIFGRRRANESEEK